jgi:hypothetical protein
LFVGTRARRRRRPVADLNDRWVELLRDADGDIAVETFETVFGLDLLVTTHGVNGAIRRSRRVTHLDGSFVDVEIDSRPASNFMRHSLEWTPGLFAVLTSGSCINLARLTDDLAAVDWKPRAGAGGDERSVFAAIFRRDDNLAAYGNATEQKNRHCRLYYRSHYFDPARTDAIARRGF